MNDMTFTDNSKKIFEKFIKTAVIFDDEASIHSIVETGPMKKPGRKRLIAKSNGPKRYSKVRHSLDAKILIDSFASIGIICGVLKIDGTEKTTDPIFNSAYDSDVLILDWKINQVYGDTAIEIIKSILDKDVKDGRRLRFIVIYTAYESLNNISSRIQTVLQKYGQVEKLDEECILVQDSVKISIFAKENTPLNARYKKRVIKESELPNKIIEEITSVFCGLLPNVAIMSISCLRDQTFKLLKLFDRELDPAFLAHRCLLEYPEDASELLFDLIIGSLASILDYNEFQDWCSSREIESWLKQNNFTEKTYKINKRNLQINTRELIEWQKKGFSEAIKNIWARQNNGEFLNQEVIDKKLRYGDLHKDCHKYFSPIMKENVNEEFSILTHQKSNISILNYKPKLQLGTIIKGTKTKKYWFCLQQKCDSVRIKENDNRRFLFLPLDEVNKKFNFISFENEKYIKLKINLVTYELRTIRFKGNAKGVVRARKFGTSNKYLFCPIYNKKHDKHDKKVDENFEWILDLKDAHAQRIANDYASNLARVGLDESEWLRRS